MASILIVEDNVELLDLVADFFRSKGTFEVDTASDGNCALSLIGGKDYDIAILDIMLPGANGFEVCKALRGKSRCPIVFLTALGNESNILKGYETGCDDYVVKPFSLKVLYAKCLALLSRTEAELNREPVLECGDIRLYPLQHVKWLRQGKRRLRCHYAWAAPAQVLGRRHREVDMAWSGCLSALFASIAVQEWLRTRYQESLDHRPHYQRFQFWHR